LFRRAGNRSTPRVPDVRGGLIVDGRKHLAADSTPSRAHQRHRGRCQRRRAAHPATTKTAGSERILHLSTRLVRMIKHRRLAGHLPGPAGVIFTSPTGLLRDPSYTQADLRHVLDRAGSPWVSSHVFRKTVASRLDDHGDGIRHVADQLGHSRPSNDHGLLPRSARAHHHRLRRRARTTPAALTSNWFVSGSRRRRPARIPLYRGPPGARTRNLRIKSSRGGGNNGIRSPYFLGFLAHRQL
jgi:hypothetical protein